MSKTISISDNSFYRLRAWASVGRTIDAAVTELVQLNTEQAQFTAGELCDLKQALDECGRAAKLYESPVEH